MADRTTEVHLSGVERPLALPALLVAAAWTGPAGLGERVLASRIAQALDAPGDYPSLRENVVPGDRVVFVIDPETAGWPTILEAMIERLVGAGVALVDIAALGPPGSDRPTDPRLPPEVSWLAHTPEDRAQISYLANTRRGRRVYLNRHLVDADVVLPIGRLWRDEEFGLRGPWSAIFPEASDVATCREFRGGAHHRLPRHESGVGHAHEAAEVGWLLGSRLQVAILPGATGVADVIAGDVGKLVDACLQQVDRRWTLAVSSRADLVIVGVGEPGAPGGWDALTRAIVAAHKLVAPGGRIAVASRLTQAPGAALKHLAEADDPADALRSLSAFEHQPDYHAALRLARRDRSVPIALLSGLPDEEVEDLGFVSLRDVAELERLARTGRRIIAVNRAELTHVQVDTDP
jgi:hypothetical protein